MENLSYFNAIGAITNSALYLGALVAAGIAAGSHATVALAIITAGLAYLSYCVQIGAPGHRVAFGLSAASNVIGIAAGLALLVTYWR